MQRLKIEELRQWKEKPKRKPLIIRGARQVGKTWLLKEFGKQYYSNFVYVNFEKTPELLDLFLTNLDPLRIISVLELYANTPIKENETLIIFDEIQEAKRGLTSLKYFCEEAPNYHVVAAGSLLGIAMPYKTSFPVGKVDFLELNALSFTEYLLALGEERIVEKLKAQDWQILSIVKDKLIKHLKSYYYIGGMPEVVTHFVEHQDWEAAREIQYSILTAYEADFAKHVPPELVARVKLVWQNIPSHLAKENKKFVYGALKPGGRSRDFEEAIQWLCDAGLLYKLPRITKPELPLPAFESLTVFKLFLHDVGLLAAMSNLNAKTLIEGNKLFLQYKGALTEQYVLQQLQGKTKPGERLHYWTNERSTNEVDFIFQNNENKLVPVEVKAETNTRSKSFKFYCEKYNPVQAIRTSLSEYKKDSWLTNIPLWGIEYL